MTSNPAPGFTSHPKHSIDIQSGHSVEVSTNGMTIARSNAALLLRENTYQPVVYIPLQDVSANCLSKSDHTSYCPFKGTASYWNIVVGDETIANAAWSYDQPFDEMVKIKGCLAFYPDKVKIA